ncbi:MAG: PaaI family thioesterase [Suipraeoptans sp.]
MDYTKFIEDRNLTNPFGNLVGIKIKEMKKGYAYLELEISNKLLNPFGTLHGGVLFTLADMTGGAAAITHGEYITTVDADIHFLRPAKIGDVVYGETREIRVGTHLMVYGITITNQDKVLLSESTFTYMPIGTKVDF